GTARVCGGGAWAGSGPWTADATLAALPLSLAHLALPAGVTVTGDLNGTLHARGTSRGLADANVDLVPGPGEVRYPNGEGDPVTIRFERGSIRAQAGPGGGSATAALTFSGVGDLGVQASLPRLTQGVPVKDQPLSGQIGVHINNLSLAQGFIEGLSGVHGTFSADYRLAGTLGTPRLTGAARLRDGQATLGEYGITLKDLQMTATGDGSGSLALEASARSGPGTLTLTGNAGLLPSATSPVHLKLTGQRFQVMGTREINLLVSPDLDITYQGTSASITGQVDVPQGVIDIEQKKNAAVTASKDVVFVGGPPRAEPASRALAVTARVRIVIPQNQLRMNAMGLKAFPYGSLLVVEEPGRPVSGVGQIDLDNGIFRAYGQDLTITRGRIIFGGGPIDDPGLDIRAQRTADDGVTIAGIEAKGTVKAPEITLWSNPAMSQDEALAYLMLGHPLTQATPAEGSLLTRAATTLGISGSNLLAKRLASRFGLEEVTIESKKGLQDASLVLGKYLNPHLYVVYGIGLFDRVNTFSIRYILSKQWTLQATSGGVNSGGDILYTLDRGHTRGERGDGR
nr:translocation/assembly module TamB domain-containing protein [Acidobacteriota bacterium]